MIVTFTPNPSLDRTVELDTKLLRGEVQQAPRSSYEPGGKGINVTRALVASGTESIAVLPSDDGDPVLSALQERGIRYRALPLGSAIRSNIAITEPDGTTTKINEQGSFLSDTTQRALIDLVLDAALGARWVVLAGSLPPGVPDNFYAVLIRELRSRYDENSPLIAVDTSGSPLISAVNAQPDLIKPNGHELAQLASDLGLTGSAGFAGTANDTRDADSLERDSRRVAELSQILIESGVRSVLATLGEHGAVLATREGNWFARGSKIKARSTVGAGDSALAGYLLSQVAGLTPPDRLRQAVAHGSAAASLPGTTVPSLDQTDLEAVTVAQIMPHNFDSYSKESSS